ncbi:MAG: PepSY domain-containing protein [Rhodobacterales bacterium]|nr:PepSY domain-containing protein [Rhodobacterales bacterium]
MKRFFLSTTLAMVLSAGVAMASPFDDQIVSSLQSQGFERIEIRTGLTQVKVEAIRGQDKVEIVYDLATGAVLSQQTGRIRANDTVVPGVESRNENRDFIRVGGRSGNGHDRNGTDHNGTGHNGIDDNGSDHNGIDDNGSDHNGIDDNGSDHNGRDNNDDDNGSDNHDNGSDNHDNGSDNDDNGSDNDDNGSDRNDHNDRNDHGSNDDDNN